MITRNRYLKSPPVSFHSWSRTTGKPLWRKPQRVASPFPKRLQRQVSQTLGRRPSQPLPSTTSAIWTGPLILRGENSAKARGVEEIAVTGLRSHHSPGRTTDLKSPPIFAILHFSLSPSSLSHHLYSLTHQEPLPSTACLSICLEHGSTRRPPSDSPR